MKKAIVIVVAAMLLTGCSDDLSTTPTKTGVGVGNDYGSGSVSIVEVSHDDTTVTCAVLVGYSKGGLSCDWENAQ